jgi:hypothetical protein
LKRPHWILGAQNGHRAGQANPLGAHRRRAQNDRRRRIEKLAPVMFANAEHVETHLVCMHDLFDQLP